ncbi:MAG TPA: VOC family protein [Candidatus Margulisiibacteriota bacterium]|nr:VOC family protein [Candidatus Margulisiibacteriota bacterium]
MAQRLLDHTSICVTNVERSRQFYEDLLGLTPTERPDFGFPGMWYQLGEGQLHLIERQPADVRDNATTIINATDPHFAIEVDDLGSLRRRIQAAGAQMLEFGSGQLWVHDPDGNTVELRAPADSVR